MVNNMKFNEQIIYKQYPLRSNFDFQHATPFDWATIGTFSAIIVALLIALFQDRIRELWNRAELEIKISMTPPDCHKIGLHGQNGNFIQNCIYLRARVTNVGRKPAENTEIMISKLWEIDELGNEKIVETFLPMNLAWSHYRTNNIRIPAGVFRHCDIGDIRDLIHHTETQMRFDIIVQPYRVDGDKYPNIVSSGKYKFELITSADNAISSQSLWELEFDKVWVEDEKEMLEKHIHIKKII
ncbi:MAG: hypothetical protein UT05_C0003G0037 [Parcubacteria group bacterium GW2011_GWF2_38_76]|nr:MAG: hypothetical protein UT05_C0003G0037 [Parcubacteria group bacterium GW2011_GWF2_38_76]HBM46191.1 hypothetical protein [Patescibacteria group bacterium]